MLKRILCNVVKLLEECCVLGRDSEKFYEAVKLLKSVINILNAPEGEEEKHEDQDEQGERV